ncbi:F-actin-capping protein subunit beta [Dissostichus eleginoides]|uniref:F-actin-capping protein subunit beta n=1 Tax=Dissostichus eleginoides TaxID=100907 RepID=A0AAD9CNW4_DISEL|nr:F-actin-capping protein subunit beta [Dissostichus eleginoides]
MNRRRLWLWRAFVGGPIFSGRAARSQGHGPAPGPADSQLLKVCLTEGLGSSSSIGTSQTLVSFLKFLARVGGVPEKIVNPSKESEDLLEDLLSSVSPPLSSAHSKAQRLE